MHFDHLNTTQNIYVFMLSSLSVEGAGLFFLTDGRHHITSLGKQSSPEYREGGALFETEH